MKIVSEEEVIRMDKGWQKEANSNEEKKKKVYQKPKLIKYKQIERKMFTLIKVTATTT